MFASFRGVERSTEDPHLQVMNENPYKAVTIVPERNNVSLAASLRMLSSDIGVVNLCIAIGPLHQPSVFISDFSAAINFSYRFSMCPTTESYRHGKRRRMPVRKVNMNA